MKKNLILVGVLAALCLYAYFFVYKSEADKVQTLPALVDRPADLVEIHLTTDQGTVHLKLEDELWWVQAPQTYLADQEFVDRALGAMVETATENIFPIDQDLYGVKPGRAFFELLYKDGERKRLVVGSNEAPGSRLYIFNSDTAMVGVVHNLWAQFIHYPLSMFYQKSLPIPGLQFRGARLVNGNQSIWSVKAKSADTVEVSLARARKEIKKAELLWFFKNLKDIHLEKLEFGANAPKGDFLTLEAESEKGIIRFQFYEKDAKVYIPELKVFAVYDPVSLNSLENELKKVIQ